MNQLDLDLVKPCRHGHTTGRNADGRCIGCGLATARKQSKRQSDEVSARMNFPVMRISVKKRFCAVPVIVEIPAPVKSLANMRWW